MDMWGKFSASLQSVQNRLDSYIEDGAAGMTQPTTANVSEKQDISRERETVEVALKEAEERNRLINKEFQRLLREKEGEIKSLKQQLENQKDALSQNSDSAVQQLKEQLEQKEKDFQDLEARAEGKFTRLKQQAKTKITALQQQVETLQDELTKHEQGKSSEAGDDVDGRQTNVVDTSLLSQSEVEPNKELLDRLEAVQQEHALAEQRWLEERQRIVQQLLNLQQDSVSTAEQLHSLQTQQERDVEQWGAERAQLVAELKQQRHLVEDAERNSGAAEGITEQLQEQVQKLTSELDEARGKLSNLLEQQTVIEAERDAACQEAKHLKQVSANTDAQVEELNALVQQLQEEKKQFAESLQEKEDRFASEKEQALAVLTEEQEQRQAIELQSELHLKEMQKQLEGSVAALAEEKENTRLTKVQLASVEEKLHSYEEEHEEAIKNLKRQFIEDKEQHQTELAGANEALVSAQREVEQLLKERQMNVDHVAAESSTQAETSMLKVQHVESSEAGGWEEGAVNLVPDSADNSHVSELEQKLALVERQLCEASTQLSEVQQAQQDTKNTLEKKAKLLKAKTLKIQQLEAKLKEGGDESQRGLSAALEAREDEMRKLRELLESHENELASVKLQLKHEQDVAEGALSKKDEEVEVLRVEVERLKTAALTQAECEEELQKKVMSLEAQLTSAVVQPSTATKLAGDALQGVSAQPSPVVLSPQLPTDVAELQELLLEKDKALQEGSIKAEARFERLKEQAKRRLAVQQEKHDKEMEKLASEWEGRLAQLQAELESGKAKADMHDTALSPDAEGADEAGSWEQSLSARLQYLDQIQSSAQSAKTESPSNGGSDETVQPREASTVIHGSSEDIASHLQAWQHFGEVLEAALEQLKAGGDIDLSSTQADFDAAQHSVSIAKQLFQFTQQAVCEQQRAAAELTEAEKLLQARQEELQRARDELLTAIQAQADAEQHAASEEKHIQEHQDAHEETKQELQRVQQLLSQQQSRVDEERQRAQQEVRELTSNIEERKRQEVGELAHLLSLKNEECASLAQQLAAEQAVNKTEVDTLSSELDEQVQKNQELNTEVKSQQEQCRQLASEVIALKAAEAGARKEADKLRQSLDALRCDLDARTAELSSSKSAEEGLRIALAEAKLSAEHVEQEQKQRAAAEQSKEDEVLSWRQKANSLQKQLLDQSSQVAELQLQWSDSRGQCTRLQQRLDEAERQCSAAVSEAAKLRQSNSDTQHQLDSVLASLHAAQSSAAQQQTKAESDQNQLKRELQALKEQMQQEENRRSSAEREAAHSTEEKMRLQEKVGVLEGRLALVSHQQGCSSQEFQDLQQQLADAQANCEHLQVELDSALSGVRDRETQSVELSSEVARLMADQESLEQRLRQAVRQRDIAQQQEDQLKLQLAQVQSTAALVPKMQQQVEQATTSRRELERRLAESEHLCRQLETSGKDLQEQFEREQQRWEQEAAVWKDELEKVQQTQKELENAANSRHQTMLEPAELVKQRDVSEEGPPLSQSDASSGLADMVEVGHLRALLAEEQRLRHEAESSLAEARLLLSQHKQAETSDVSLSLGEPVDEVTASSRSIFDSYPQLTVVTQVVSGLTQRLRSQRNG